MLSGSLYQKLLTRSSLGSILKAVSVRKWFLRDFSVQYFFLFQDDFRLKISTNANRGNKMQSVQKGNLQIHFIINLVAVKVA